MTLRDLFENKEKRFILVGGKGGTGKTSTSCAIATRFAREGEKTLIVSTDPAHSISDSFEVDLSGGEMVEIPGFEGNLFGLEVDATNAGESFGEVLGLSGTENEINEFMQTMNSLGIDEMGDLFETAPPGLDEAVALAKVIQFLKSEEYRDFTKVIFDTAPTGHTLRLLALPDVLDTFIVKLMRVRSKVSNMFGAFKALLSGQPKEKKSEIDALEEIKKIVVEVKKFFQDEKHTEFIVVGIPTLMAIKESERLVKQLRHYNIAINEIVINQVMPDNTGCKFCKARAANQESNLEYIKETFDDLHITFIPFFDREIRGIEALQMMGERLF